MLDNHVAVRFTQDVYQTYSRSDDNSRIEWIPTSKIVRQYNPFEVEPAMKRKVAKLKYGALQELIQLGKRPDMATCTGLKSQLDRIDSYVRSFGALSYQYDNKKGVFFLANAEFISAIQTIKHAHDLFTALMDDDLPKIDQYMDTIMKQPFTIVDYLNHISRLQAKAMSPNDVQDQDKDANQKIVDNPLHAAISFEGQIQVSDGIAGNVDLGRYIIREQLAFFLTQIIEPPELIYSRLALTDDGFPTYYTELLPENEMLDICLRPKNLINCMYLILLLGVRNMRMRICRQCGAVFEPNRTNQKFCKTRCQSNFNSAETHAKKRSENK